MPNYYIYEKKPELLLDMIPTWKEKCLIYFLPVLELMSLKRDLNYKIWI